MTEQGAAADTAGREWSARRRRALRKGPRAPGPPPPSKHWVPEAWRAGWPLAKAGLTEPRTLRGASRRSIPLPFGREKENRETGASGRPKTKNPGRRSVG